MTTNTNNNRKSYRIAKEVKDQILKRVKEEGVSVSQAAQDHGIKEKTIYKWLTKGVSGSPSWAEVARLKKENKALLELVGSLTIKLLWPKKTIEPRNKTRLFVKQNTIHRGNRHVLLNDLLPPQDARQGLVAKTAN